MVEMYLRGDSYQSLMNTDSCHQVSFTYVKSCERKSIPSFNIILTWKAFLSDQTVQFQFVAVQKSL